MTEKACKQCKRIVRDSNTCPICKESKLTSNWKGFVTIFDPEKSEIAKKFGVNIPGKYALRLGK